MLLGQGHREVGMAQRLQAACILLHYNCYRHKYPGGTDMPASPY